MAIGEKLAPFGFANFASPKGNFFISLASMKKHLLSLGSLVLVSAVSADEIRSAIDEGISAYEAGKFSLAAAQLDLASQLLREKSGAAIAEAFPEAPEGWETEGEANVEAIGGGFMGGMTTADQTYTDGSGRVTIRIVTDSPMIAQLSMLLSNPAMVRQMGQKTVKIGNGQALLNFDGDSGTLTQVIAGRYLVTVEGSGVEESTMTDFASAIDTSKLPSQ